MGITERYGPSERERITGLPDGGTASELASQPKRIPVQFKVPTKVVRAVTGISEMLLRQIEEWVSEHTEPIPVGEIRLFISELREKLC